ncbi:hypothetical protein [Streptosporangium sandarakinum]
MRPKRRVEREFPLGPARRFRNRAPCRTWRWATPPAGTTWSSATSTPVSTTSSPWTDLGTAPWTANHHAFTGGNPVSYVEIDGHLFGLSLSDVGHLTLDVVGMVPVVGEVADLANAA